VGGQDSGQVCGTAGEVTEGEGGGRQVGLDFGDGRAGRVVPIAQQVGHAHGGCGVGGEPFADLLFGSAIAVCPLSRAFTVDEVCLNLKTMRRV